MRISKIYKTCSCCPSQWEIELSDGRMIYARYRWGVLAVEQSKKPTKNIYDAMEPDGELVLFGRVGNEMDGKMSTAFILELLQSFGYKIDSSVWIECAIIELESLGVK